MKEFVSTSARQLGSGKKMKLFSIVEEEKYLGVREPSTNHKAKSIAYTSEKNKSSAKKSSSSISCCGKKAQASDRMAMDGPPQPELAPNNAKSPIVSSTKSKKE